MTVKYENFADLFADKTAELKSTIERLKTDDNISKNTRGTQLYAKKRELKTLKLIEALLTQSDLSDELYDHLVALTTLTSERVKGSVEIHDGDTIIALLQKYPDVKDPWGKFMKYAQHNGFEYNNVTGVFTKTN